MKKRLSENFLSVYLSRDDTYSWAHKPGAAWPCSTLAGHTVFAEYDSNGLCDLKVDGYYSNEDGSYGPKNNNNYIDGHEFNAIMADTVKGFLPAEHTLYFVIVGQFE